MTSPVFGYDITIPATDGNSPQLIIRELKQWAKKWAFQREVSEEKKYNHYQVRLSLFKKKRLAELAKKLSTTALKGHLSISSTESGNKFSYVMKADTRVEGPWDDTQDAPAEAPKDLKEIKELRPWQKEVKEDCTDEKTDRRIINVIYDPSGNIGKSIFIKWMKWNKLAEYIPPFKDLEKFMGYCMSMFEAKAYMIDMPKALDKRNLSGFWAGIESLKNGMLYDWRNKGQSRVMSCPKIWVFTNTIPKMDDLSKDRWKIWMVDNHNNLCDWSPKIATWIAKTKEDSKKITTVKKLRLPFGMTEDDVIEIE